MLELLNVYGITTVLVVLLIAIPTLVRFISWCKTTWKQREEFKKENIQKGIEIEKKKEQEEIAKQETENRLAQLEKLVAKQTTLIEKQQQQIDLLIESDKLDIKSWIKAQHEIWIPRQCIDSQTLDLLTQRFELYEKEGGNSWAKKMEDELKALPVVTVIPIAPNQTNS